MHLPQVGSRSWEELPLNHPLGELPLGLPLGELPLGLPQKEELAAVIGQHDTS